jgi:glutaredoxin
MKKGRLPRKKKKALKKKYKFLFGGKVGFKVLTFEVQNIDLKYNEHVKNLHLQQEAAERMILGAFGVPRTFIDEINFLTMV